MLSRLYHNPSPVAWNLLPAISRALASTQPQVILVPDARAQHIVLGLPGGEKSAVMITALITNRLSQSHSIQPRIQQPSFLLLILPPHTSTSLQYHTLSTLTRVVHNGHCYNPGQPKATMVSEAAPDEGAAPGTHVHGTGMDLMISNGKPSSARACLHACLSYRPGLWIPSHNTTLLTTWDLFCTHSYCRCWTSSTWQALPSYCRISRIKLVTMLISSSGKSRVQVVSTLSSIHCNSYPSLVCDFIQKGYLCLRPRLWSISLGRWPTR